MISDFSEPIVCRIDEEGTIYQYNGRQRGMPIGVDTQREKEMLAQIEEMQGLIDNYYEKLVELGVIKPPKTPEEVAREAAEEQLRIVQEQARQQSEINLTLLDAVKGLQAEMAALKTGGAANVSHSEKLPEIKGVSDNGEAGSGDSGGSDPGEKAAARGSKGRFVAAKKSGDS